MWPKLPQSINQSSPKSYIIIIEYVEHHGVEFPCAFSNWDEYIWAVIGDFHSYVNPFEAQPYLLWKEIGNELLLRMSSRKRDVTMRQLPFLAAKTEP